MRNRGAKMRLAMVMVACAWHGAYAVTIDFESILPGTQWGSETGQNPGDPILSESNIMLSVETFQFGPSQTEFFRAEVPGPQGRFVDAFPTQEMTFDGINVLFDFSQLGYDVDFVSLEFGDFGGTSNFGVNGGTLHILDPLSGLPSDVAPGVSASVIGGSRIELVANGSFITSFQIGGQELAIDNVNVVPEPATAMFLLAGALAFARRRLFVRRPQI